MVDKIEPIVEALENNQTPSPNANPNEERIRLWREKRLADAAIAAKARADQAQVEREKRIRQAQSDREERAIQFRGERQEQLENLSNEKRLEALSKLPDEKLINEKRLAMIAKHHQEKRSFFIRVFMFIVIPAFLIFAYVGLFSTPFYEAESVVTVKTNDPNINGAGFPTLIGASVGGGIMQNIFSAREYILSREMMNRMEKEQGYLTYFNDSNIDFLSRPFPNRMTGHDEYDYYLRRVKVAVDIQEGVLKIQVQGKTPQDAKRFADALLKYAEDWENNLADRMISDKINDAHTTLATSENELQAIRKELVNFQIANGDLNPRETTSAAYASTHDIELKIKEAEREIGIYQKARVQDSPVVARLNERLAILRQQKNDINRNLVGNGDKALNKVLAGFEYVSIKKDIAQQKWETALKNVEISKAEAFRQRQYFLTIVPPIASELPAEPQKLKLFVLSLIALSGLYGLVSILFGSVKTTSMKK